MSAAESVTPPDARRVLISVNPKAGPRSAGPQVDQLSQLLTEDGYSVESTTDIDHLADQATQALEKGDLRAVVAVGGDGTAGLVTNRTPPGTPLTLLPQGTENLLARYLGVTASVSAAHETIRSGSAIQFDAGKVGDQIFLLMSGFGFDAEVVRRLHAERTGHIHHLSYAKPIIDSIRKYDYPELRVYCDDASDPITARWAFVVNLPRYAGGLRLAPEASGVDGLLDVCTFKKGFLLNGLRYLAGVVLGRHESWRDCNTARVQRVRIESDSPVPFQLDGDPGGFLPVEIEVIPRRLTILTTNRALSRN